MHADAETKLLSVVQLQEALVEFGIIFEAAEAEELFVAMDTDGNGGLDLQAFTRALIRPPTEVEQFVGTLPLTGVLAACLSEPGADDPLKALCKLASNNSELQARIDAFIPSLREILDTELRKLQKMVKAMEADNQRRAGDAGSKFAAFMIGMNAGTPEEFFKGLEDRIGMYAFQIIRM